MSSGNGSITFVQQGAGAGAGSAGLPWPLKLSKAVFSNQPTNGDDNKYLIFNKTEVLQNSTDILGNMLLGIHGFPARAVRRHTIHTV